MAYSWLTLRLVYADSIASVIVIPADGPSFGTAPSGICIWISLFSKSSLSIPYSDALDLIYPSATIADSFITSPSCPVSVISPLPSIMQASTSRVTPPTAVHASPFTIPTASDFNASSLSNLMVPRYSLRLEALILLVCVSPETIFAAALRHTAAMLLSNSLTPASLVYPSIIPLTASLLNDTCLVVSPFFLICFGIRCSLAI